ncbi:MAG: hypothetical protein GWO24_07245, partial [Akkermansiaceae bacterium]|nr:hypothetical protein [Akkermansiaceae bacterium]
MPVEILLEAAFDGVPGEVLDAVIDVDFMAGATPRPFREKLPDGFVGREHDLSGEPGLGLVMDGDETGGEGLVER